MHVMDRSETWWSVVVVCSCISPIWMALPGAIRRWVTCISMNNAMFRQVHLTDIRFRNVKLDYISFESHSVLGNCTVEKWSMQASDWSQATTPRLVLKGYLMANSNMSNTSMICAEFAQTNLDQIDFTGAVLDRGKFVDVNMRSCALTNVTLSTGILIKVDMTQRTGEILI